MKTCRLFFVHGIGNENRDAESILTEWLHALKAAWSRDGRSLDHIRIDANAAYYGNKLADVTRNWLANEFSIRDQGPEQEPPEERELFALYQEYAEALAASGRLVPLGSETGDELVVTEMGFPHHECVKALARTIEALSPENGSFLAKKFLPQAAVYLKRPGAAIEIDRMVKEQMGHFVGDASNMIVVSHSLGSVVSYRILRALGSRVRVPMFMTLGSPLASEAVRKILPLPRKKPEAVGTWINAADSRDFVALHPELNSTTFGPAEIQNLADISNEEEDRHSIVGYLRNPAISGAIWDAIRQSS